MAQSDKDRIPFIDAILAEKSVSSRYFVQYMAQKHQYSPEDALHLREAHFLMALGPDEGKPMSEIAKALSVTKGAASQTAGRLAKKGYLLRQPDPNNHRLVIAELTEKGREFYRRHLEFDRSEYAKMDSDYLFRFSEEQLRLILEYEKCMTAIFENAVAKDKNSHPAKNTEE